MFQLGLSDPPGTQSGPSEALRPPSEDQHPLLVHQQQGDLALPVLLLHPQLPHTDQQEPGRPAEAGDAEEGNQGLRGGKVTANFLPWLRCWCWGWREQQTYEQELRGSSHLHRVSEK